MGASTLDSLRPMMEKQGLMAAATLNALGPIMQNKGLMAAATLNTLGPIMKKQGLMAAAVMERLAASAGGREAAEMTPTERTDAWTDVWNGMSPLERGVAIGALVVVVTLLHEMTRFLHDTTEAFDPIGALIKVSAGAWVDVIFVRYSIAAGRRDT